MYPNRNLRIKNCLCLLLVFSTRDVEVHFLNQGVNIIRFEGINTARYPSVFCFVVSSRILIPLRVLLPSFTVSVNSSASLLPANLKVLIFLLFAVFIAFIGS